MCVLSRLARFGSGFLPLLVPGVCAADIIINEIHYRPDVKIERAEFIELFNDSAQPVTLSGWRISGGVNYQIPFGIEIPAGGYLVVAEDPGQVQSKYGAAALGPWQGSLSNEGERIELRNAAGKIEDEVEYKLGFPWPTVGEPPGYSIELIHPSFDNDLGGNWRASVVEGAGEQPGDLIPFQAEWRYWKGTQEPEGETGVWRAMAFDDSGWARGDMPVGYGSDIPMGTYLADMNSRYTTVYLRRSFVVNNPGAINSLVLSARYDDGFKVWLNGQPIRDGAFNMAPGEQPYTALAASTREDNGVEEHNLDGAASFLVKGTNIIAIQAANILKEGSSDFFIDVSLRAVTGGVGHGPTPGAANSVLSSNAPPQIRQVTHLPEQPRSGQTVTITAKITDPDGVASVKLLYQVVKPGSYIELSDPAYESTWTEALMADAGTGGDAHAGDGIYTSVLPGDIQQHRALIRYRIVAADAKGAEIRAPYLDDPQPNFAYFCYDGVPSWTGAVRPGSTPATTFSADEMSRLPIIHLISTKTEVETATWTSQYAGDAYPWTGTLVYDGRVYDHISFRARGGVWRYAMVKNMWKFDFKNGHDFQMKDDYGHEYDVKWTKLNLGASIQQGDYGHRGEQGMFESVGFRLFNLAGVESPVTTFVQLRIIDEAAEASSSQYQGDFWGVYLAVEQENGRFLDQHGLPDGNLYKMENGTGELNNLGKSGPLNKSDLNQFLNTYRNSNPSEQWWRSNMRLTNYWSYQAIVQGIHHYDICYGKNYFYFKDPDSGLWSVHTWDLDLTWADNMYDSGCGGQDDLYRPLLGGWGSPRKPSFDIEFRNRVREISDLLFNTDQAWQLIDEHALLLRGTNKAASIVEADRRQWDFNPRMASSGKAGQGSFYAWPYEPWVSKDFEGGVQLMKDYIVQRAGLLAAMAQDSAIPMKPGITYSGTEGFPANDLRFQSSSYQGQAQFAAMQWRIGEISDEAAPAFDRFGPRAYEITPVWESGILKEFSPEVRVPAGTLKVGHVYRARVRVGDVNGRWSHWSDPVQFIAGEAANAALLVEHLRLSELMIDPDGDSAFEFVELHNVSPERELDLGGVKFTAGIDFTFPLGAQIGPGEYVLVRKGADELTFRSFYNLPATVQVFGPYSGSLANDGEELTLRTAPAGEDIFTFEYSDGRGWPVATQGAGHSLVPMPSAIDGQAKGALDYPGNWRPSVLIKGSPGAGEPAPIEPAVLLNEVAAHTDYADPSQPDYASNDWIEIINVGASPILLEDFYLSDDPGNLRKWRIPNQTLAARGRIVFDEVSGFHNPLTSGFGLDKAGEQVLLSYLPDSAGEDRVVDAVSFKGQENGQSWSRYPDGAAWWYATPPTRDQANRSGAVGVSISEIMYHPADNATGDETLAEYVEIFNPLPATVTLDDTNGAWRLDGGVSFVFPTGTVIGPGEALVVVSFDPVDTAVLSAFKSLYTNLEPNVSIVGPYTGKLSNASDRVALEKPQAPDTAGEAYSWVILDEVIYWDQSVWPVAPDGNGSALARVTFASTGNDPGNWIAAPPTPGHAESPALDSDGDGMSDIWEIQNGLDRHTPEDALTDADGDGASNLSEYLSGTDPRDPTSMLRLQAESVDGHTVLIFEALADRSYVIEFRGQANAGAWQTLEEIAAAPTRRTVEVKDETPDIESRFYRLVTPRVP